MENKGVSMSWESIDESIKWIFGGVGGTALVTICGFLFNRKNKRKESTQSIDSGDSSTNIQGRDNMDINIGNKK